MLYKEYVMPFDELFLTTIGDLHIGDKGFTKESEKVLVEKINSIFNNDNAFAFLNGDILNLATRNSKSSPFEQTMNLEEQIDKAVELFYPTKDRILGAVDGNHEHRMADFSGYSPTVAVCSMLGIPYFKYTAVLDLKMGKKMREDRESTRVSYVLVFSHTTGGGKKVGSKINRVDEMRTTTVTNADGYFGSHNHMLGAVPLISKEYDSRNKCIIDRVQLLVDCGGYLQWDNSYPEKGQLQPFKVGSPTVILNGKKKEMQVIL